MICTQSFDEELEERVIAHIRAKERRPVKIIGFLQQAGSDAFWKGTWAAAQNHVMTEYGPDARLELVDMDSLANDRKKMTDTAKTISGLQAPYCYVVYEPRGYQVLQIEKSVSDRIAKELGTRHGKPVVVLGCIQGSVDDSRFDGIDSVPAGSAYRPHEIHPITDSDIADFVSEEFTSGAGIAVYPTSCILDPASAEKVAKFNAVMKAKICEKPNFVIYRLQEQSKSVL